MHNIDEWWWVDAENLQKGDMVCLDYGYSDDTSSLLDFLHMNKYEVVFTFRTNEGGYPKTFITHDGIERKLPNKHPVWTYPKR